MPGARAPVALAVVVGTLVGSAVPAAADAEFVVTVSDGDLLISVDRERAALLPSVLAGARYAVTGSLGTLTVVDTRVGDPGWNAAGQVSSFVTGSGAVPGYPLSWTPEVLDHSSVQVLTVGSVVRGLGASRVLAVAGPAAGRGTARLTAGLEVLLPDPGETAAVLTITVI
ncbi:hypothetical protein V5P93_002457 [Actinokineospora auranticolor]|uniref:Uncharacterized protein n=1 Tax=Actinokineospora auranticolor TaxID=155976 RepID=A0A2S6GMP6_9PSEU|nr:hypothetical protein [Actinokineospora auranticolor]PPK66512.1 hypothetical protein CLV40_110216 [Actinokineospora auranticolor]